MSDIASGMDWADIYTEFANKIHRYIYRQVSDYHLAEDLTADVFTRAIEQHSKGVEIESFSGWLHRSAHNAIIDHYRARDRRNDTQIPDALQCTLPTPHEVAERLLDAEQVRAAIDKLPEGQAAVITRWADGYEFAEIATETGKNSGAVKALKHRGLESLHSSLSAYMGVEGERMGVTNCVEEVAALLQERGPMTVTDMQRALHFTRSQVEYAVWHYGNRFAIVGSVPIRGGHPAHVWGLVGAE